MIAICMHVVSFTCYGFLLFGIAYNFQANTKVIYTNTHTHSHNARVLKYTTKQKKTFFIRLV